MTISKFIENAIDGGWNRHKSPGGKHVFKHKTWWWEWPAEDEYGNTILMDSPCCYDSRQYQYLWILDPEAWKAVGKVEGWKDGGRNPRTGEVPNNHWRSYMHRMIDHLAEGGTIESYLETL